MSLALCKPYNSVCCGEGCKGGGENAVNRLALVGYYACYIVIAGLAADVEVNSGVGKLLGDFVVVPYKVGGIQALYYMVYGHDGKVGNKHGDLSVFFGIKSLGLYVIKKLRRDYAALFSGGCACACNVGAVL